MLLSYVRSGFARPHARMRALASSHSLCALAALSIACSIALATPFPASGRTTRCARHHRHRGCRRRHIVQHRSAQAATGCPNATTPATASSAQAMDAAVLCLVNEQRTKRGLPSLAQQSQLETVAQQWTDSMVSSGQFTHGLNFAGRITASGYGYKAAGENIATGAPTPLAVLTAWMRSADHCRNILTPTYRDIGTGVNPHPVKGWATAPSTWTEDFGLSMFQSAPSQNWGPADGCPY